MVDFPRDRIPIIGEQRPQEGGGETDDVERVRQLLERLETHARLMAPNLTETREAILDVVRGRDDLADGECSFRWNIFGVQVEAKYRLSPREMVDQETVIRFLMELVGSMTEQYDAVRKMRERRIADGERHAK